MAKIVVVEDEPLILMVLVELLEELGHEAIDFPRAEPALAYARGNTFDILITDMNLPTMGGQDLALEVRELFPNKPVIYATGYVVNEIDQLAEPFATVTKPFWLDNISDAIDKVLGLTDS